MKLGLISSSFFPLVGVIPAVLALAGCSGIGNPLGNAGGQTSDGGVPSTNVPPHALGVIALGFEVVHTGTGSTTTSTPSVLASFLPDSTVIAPACTTSPAPGCTMAMVPKCDGSAGNPPPCPTGLFCQLNASCQSVCQEECTLPCGAGEECYLTQTAQACRPTQTFDAGDLTFLGTTSAISLIPPSYPYDSSSSTGAPFAPGKQIEVIGSGATGAGFAPFDETFTPTTNLQTSPSLGLLNGTQVFNPSGFTVGWQIGSDSIVIGVSGSAGSVQCTAVDSTGTFTVPYAVVSAVTQAGTVGAGGLGETQTVTVSVTRQRLEQKTNAKTQGSLTDRTVQPIAYLDLATSSSETVTVTGTPLTTTCPGAETLCSDGCVNLLTSNSDCGKCGNSCGSSYCSSGTCYGTTPICTGTLTACGGVCVNTLTSNTNCGTCGNACSSGYSCQSGECLAVTSCGSLTNCGADGCQNLQTSSTDCGTCGNSCDGGTCTKGVCSTVTTTCATCETTAEGAACATQYNACEADSNCGNYSSCMSGCAATDTTCKATCKSTYSTGATEAESLQSCICTSQCSTSCSSDAYCTSAL